MDVTAWTSERPQASVFKCGDCTKVYQSYSSFCRHRNVHSGVKYSCPRCGATFAVKNYVTQHLKRSKGCKQGSKTQKECAAAEKTRRPKKSLQCTSCNSRFANLPAMHRHTCKNLNVAYEIFLKEGQDVFDLDLGEPQAEEQPEYNIVMQWDELPWSVQFDVQPLQTDVQQEEEPLQTDVKQEPQTLHTSFDVQQEEETLQVKQEPLQVQQEPLQVQHCRLTSGKSHCRSSKRHCRLTSSKRRRHCRSSKSQRHCRLTSSKSHCKSSKSQRHCRLTSGKRRRHCRSSKRRSHCTRRLTSSKRRRRRTRWIRCKNC
jgi:uncharacterized C2H2 Zn-finger protein